MNELALFFGGGGGILGSFLLGHRIVCGVENDPYCREIIMRRQEEGHIPAFPIWDDATTFDGIPWRGIVDIVSAGFPCQPWSLAGKRQGVDDKRNLWPCTFGIIQQVRPKLVMLENVPGIRKFLPVVIRDLRRAGYTVLRPVIVAAAAVGAGHIRKRIWILAYDESQCERSGLCESEQTSQRGGRFNDSIAQEVFADDIGLRQRDQQGRRECPCRQPEAIGENVAQEELFAYSECSGLQGHGWDETGRNKPGRIAQEPPGSVSESDVSGRRCNYWNTEPGLARLVLRPANRVERIKVTGNIQLPAVVRLAWKVLTERAASMPQEVGQKENIEGVETHLTTAKAQNAANKDC